LVPAHVFEATQRVLGRSSGETWFKGPSSATLCIAVWQWDGGRAQSIARLDDGEAGDVVGHLEEGAAGILAGMDAFETGFDAGDTELAHLIGGRFAGGCVRKKLLPVGNLLGNLGPEERRQVRQLRA